MEKQVRIRDEKTVSIPVEDVLRLAGIDPGEWAMANGSTLVSLHLWPNYSADRKA
jgi:hypothetical protein